MAINVVYDPNLEVAGQAAYSGGQGIGAAQQDQFDRELMLRQQGLLEQQRQFNIDTGYRTQQAGNQDFLQRSQLAQQGQQFNVQTRQRDLAMLNDYLQNQQQGQLQAQQQQLYAENLAQQAQAQKEQTARSMYGQFGALARQQQQQKFEMAQSTQKAIIEARQKNLISQEQYQNEAIPKWEEQTGMPWGFLDQMAAEHQQAQEQDQVQAFVESAPRDPITQEPLISAEAYRSTGGDPKLINNLYTKAMSEFTRRSIEANDMKGQAEIEKKNHEMALTAEARRNDIATDNESAALKREQDRVNAEQQRFIEAQKFIHEMEMDRQKMLATPVLSPDGKMIYPDESKLRPLPTIEQLLHPGDSRTAGAQPQAGTGSTPSINTQAEYDALPSGAIYIDAQTGQRERKP